MANPTDEQSATQLEIARADDEKERKRLKCNLKFVKKTDDLQTAIRKILESWLERELTTDEKIMTPEDLVDIAQQLRPLSQVLVPGFFNRVI